MKKSDLFPSNYWKASDLPVKGVPLRIAKTEREPVGQDRKHKGVVYFRGEEKRLILNGTNFDAIADICGYDTQEWAGKVIVLYPSETPYAGKPVACIRVRAPKASPQAPGPPVDDPDDLRFPPEL